MAIIFDSNAVHCRVWGIPIPFCYQRGNVEPNGEPSTDAPSVGTLLVLVILALAAGYVVLGRLKKLA